MKKGYFGDFGGRFSPELLMPPLLEVEDAYKTIVKSKPFLTEFGRILTEYVGRSTPLTFCPNLSRELGFNLYLKREDLAHTGAHKINNTIGQALLAKHMGKKTLLAETGAGQHGVATATAAAYLGLNCIVYMGATDVKRQAHNVRRMQLLGAEVRPVESGTKTLKDAINAAFRFWISEQADTHYCFGTAAGPHPFPALVRDFQSVVGHEARQQSVEQFGTLPDLLVACVGGGSNAIGLFHAFMDDRDVRMVGVEAAGSGEPGCYHSMAICKGTPGVFHGARTQLLQTEDGQIEPSHSIAPGLDYPGVGPEHAWLDASGRAEYVSVNDAQALNAFQSLCRHEGIIPALESSHAVAYVLEYKDDIPAGSKVIVNLSGRGDKDMGIIEEYLG
ncbi:tryptophan synthase subunit beta [Desulfovibrio ferrophilus]|uniref:Tryptophan synthase beta chain n=1 Tax=Desulfovibrio ferrophilus TaxID=241368 RepID=A0A2Z6B2M7_9BACT|nr:tryptophan synthase subunit beta [Desulfovibrio ferrophilus]BBD09742.1 tryptophan synthase subunit beta [Desulfovibrio ferrophilus]